MRFENNNASSINCCRESQKRDALPEAAREPFHRKDPDSKKLQNRDEPLTNHSRSRSKRYTIERKSTKEY